MSYLDKLVEVAKVNMKTTLAYTAAAWGAFIITVIEIFIFYYIWMAIYNGESSLNGLSRQQMTTYIILSRIIYTQFSWSYIYWVGQKIQTGEIAMDLLRPLDFQAYMYSSRMGDFFAFAMLTAVPALIISTLTLGLYIPHNPMSYVYFGVSFILAITLAFFMEFSIGLMAFYTSYTWGLGVFYESLMSFFSGAIVPLVFFPGWLKHIVGFLPFKDIMYTPISIYLEQTSGSHVSSLLLTQVMWIVVLFFASRIVYSYLIKKVTVQGG